VFPTGEDPGDDRTLAMRLGVVGWLIKDRGGFERLDDLVLLFEGPRARD
jgi:hypothetical protein